MKAEIIAVGTELISGDIANTNAQYLSRRLLELGIEVNYHIALDDNAARLKRALMQAVGRSDIILVTGGLGPTPDDLTKETICQALHIDLVEHEPSLEQMKRYFDRIGRPMADINRKQAMMPAGATVFPNDVGTAPGCAMEAGNQCIVLLPGPPREMKPMFENYVIGFLNRYLDGVIVTHTVRVFGMGESTIAERIQELLAAEQPVVATYASDGEVRIKITASGDKTSLCEERCQQVMKTICERLGDVVYGIDQPDLETVVVDALRRKGIKIAVAESCTAGLLSKRITDIPGASEVFECGVTTYSNQMKSALLGVSPKFIEENGAVSEIVAKEMARGVLRTGQAGLALSITGIAGPGGGTREKPVGLVWLAMTDGQSIWTRKIMAGHGGKEREFIRTLAASHALDMARLYLEERPAFLAQGKPLTDTAAIASTGFEEEWDYNADRLISTQAEPKKSKKLPWYTRLRRYLFPMKGDRPQEVVRKLIFLFSMICILVAGGFIAQYYMDTLIQNSSKPNAPTIGEVTSRDPSVPAEIVDRFADLWMQNNDIKGWLTIPNTKTNNPVVQSSIDDPEYYLKRLFDGTSNRYGTIFLDAHATMNQNTMSQNLVLYGHNMKDGEMLGEAQKKYRQLSFYKENPVIQFDSAYHEESIYWKVFAVFITNADPAQDNGYVFPYTQYSFSSQDEFMDWIDQVKARSLYHTSVDIQPNDQILTLSTCTYEINNGRLVIMARRMRDGESTEVDVSSAATNSSIVYPQAWCDKYNVSKVSEPSTVSQSSSVPAASSEQASSSQESGSSSASSSRPSTASSRPSTTSSRPSTTSSADSPVTSTEPPPDQSTISSDQPISSEPSSSDAASEPSSDSSSDPAMSGPDSSEAPPPDSSEPVSSEAVPSEAPSEPLPSSEPVSESPPSESTPTE